MRKNFWNKVLKTETCWIWQGAISGTGYGTCQFNKKPESTHRVAWILSGNNLIEDEDICHSCNNRACVNPKHLYSGTRQENMDQAKYELRIRIGESHHNSKLLDNDIKRIKQLRNIGMKLDDIALIFKVNHQTISKICNRDSWKHIK